PAGVGEDMVWLGAAGLDEHVADPLVEAHVRPALAVQVAEIAPTDAELDPAVAVVVRRHAVPRADLSDDPGGDLLHGCRSTSDSVDCPGSVTPARATPGRCSPRS